MSLSEADKAIRATGIGASEAWKIVENKGPHDVFLRLVHPHLLVESENDAGLPARKGTVLEPLVAEIFAERYGLPLDRIERGITTLRHPEHPFILATLDGVVHWPPNETGAHETSLLEIKCPTWNTRDDWGPDGSEEPDAFPLKYRIQVTLQMAVRGIHSAHLAAMIEGDPDIRVYPVAWDQELADLIVARLVHFWHAYVLTRDAPPTDGSEAAADFLRKRYPRNTSTLRVPSSDIVCVVETGENLDGDAGLARELAAVKSQIKALKARGDLLTNIAMHRTGEAEGVEGLWTWKLPTKGKGRTAWSKVAAEAKVPAALIQKHTKPPQRAFRLIGGDDDNEESAA